MKYITKFKQFESEDISVDLEKLDSLSQTGPSQKQIDDLESKSDLFKLVRSVTKCQNKDIRISDSEELTQVVITLPCSSGDIIYICQVRQVVRGSTDYELIDGKLDIIKTYKSMELYDSDKDTIDNFSKECVDYGVKFNRIGKQNIDYVNGWLVRISKSFWGGGKKKLHSDLNLNAISDFLVKLQETFVK